MLAERSKTGVFRSGSGSSCVKFMDIDLFALFENATLRSNVKKDYLFWTSKI